MAAWTASNGLQAAIILVVFVYSMARKGPRAILDAAEVRRRPN